MDFKNHPPSESASEDAFTPRSTSGPSAPSSGSGTNSAFLFASSGSRPLPLKAKRKHNASSQQEPNGLSPHQQSQQMPPPEERLQHSLQSHHLMPNGAFPLHQMSPHGALPHYLSLNGVMPQMSPHGALPNHPQTQKLTNEQLLQLNLNFQRMQQYPRQDQLQQLQLQQLSLLAAHQPTNANQQSGPQMVPSPLGGQHPPLLHGGQHLPHELVGQQPAQLNGQQSSQLTKNHQPLQYQEKKPNLSAQQTGHQQLKQRVEEETPKPLGVLQVQIDQESEIVRIELHSGSSDISGFSASSEFARASGRRGSSESLRPETSSSECTESSSSGRPGSSSSSGRRGSSESLRPGTSSTECTESSVLSSSGRPESSSMSGCPESSSSERPSSSCGRPRSTAFDFSGEAVALSAAAPAHAASKLSGASAIAALRAVAETAKERSQQPAPLDYSVKTPKTPVESHDRISSNEQPHTTSSLYEQQHTTSSSLQHQTTSTSNDFPNQSPSTSNSLQRVSDLPNRGSKQRKQKNPQHLHRQGPQPAHQHQHLQHSQHPQPSQQTSRPQQPEDLTTERPKSASEITSPAPALQHQLALQRQFAGEPRPASAAEDIQAQSLQELLKLQQLQSQREHAVDNVEKLRRFCESHATNGDVPSNIQAASSQEALFAKPQPPLTHAAHELGQPFGSLAQNCALEGSSAKSSKQKKQNQKDRKAMRQAEANDDDQERSENDVTKYRVKEGVSNDQMQAALAAILGGANPAVPKNPFGGQQHFANMLGAAEQQQQMAEMLQIQMRQQTFLQQGPSSGEYESPQFMSPEPMHPQLQQRFQQQKQPLPLPPKGKKEEDMTPEEAAARKRYRRVKNNVSAKKCRDSRKRIAQTNEIVVSVFEENNPKMRDQLEKTRALLEKVKLQVCGALMQRDLEAKRSSEGRG